MNKTNKGGEQHSTNDGTAISLRPLCSDAYGQDKGGEQRSRDDGTVISLQPLCSNAVSYTHLTLPTTAEV